MNRFVNTWLAGAALLAFGFAGAQAFGLDNRAAGGTVLVGDDDQDAFEGMTRKQKEALKERLAKLPAERRDAILKRIASLKPEQRKALFERFMGSGKPEPKHEKKTDKKGEKGTPKKGEKKHEKKHEKKSADDEGTLGGDWQERAKEMLKGSDADRMEKAREMFESFTKNNPEALKEIRKYAEQARKQFEGMGPDQRKQIEKFFQLDNEKRNAILKHFRDAAGEFGRDGGKKGGKKGARDGGKKGKKGEKRDDGKKGKKGRKDQGRGEDRGPQMRNDFLRRLPPQIREKLQQLFKRLQQGRGKGQGRDLHKGRSGDRGGDPGAQFRDALRKHLQDLHKGRGNEDEGRGKGKKGPKKGDKKGQGKKGHKKNDDIIL